MLTSRRSCCAAGTGASRRSSTRSAGRWESLSNACSAHHGSRRSPAYAPATGVNEDPVTGSAHCCLTPFWAARLGKAEMLAYQASARGGMVRVRLRGDRVDLGGQAVTILEGELLVEPNIRGESSPPSDSPPAR
ncbi:PhzF family phenazine biosynthesis protein [Sorangium sp. So ce1153]